MATDAAILSDMVGVMKVMQFALPSTGPHAVAATEQGGVVEETCWDRQDSHGKVRDLSDYDDEATGGSVGRRLIHWAMQPGNELLSPRVYGS